MSVRATHLATVVSIAALVILTLTLAPRATAQANGLPGTIGRANLDGTAANQNFITGANFPCGVAVDGSHIYWANQDTNTIGRANLDGSGVDQSFITGANGPCGVAVDGSHIYWSNFNGDTIGRAGLDGSGAEQGFITGADGACGVAVDSAHVYWAHALGLGRANLDGSGVDQGFIDGGFCGVAVDAAHVYWSHPPSLILRPVPSPLVGRANLDGTGVDQSFIVGGTGAGSCGVTVDAAHVYWLYGRGPGIGRANLDGTDIDAQGFIVAGLGCGVAANATHVYWTDHLRELGLVRVKRNKRRGTAKLSVVVPGPGDLALAKTKKVKAKQKRADSLGTVKLTIRPKRKAKASLKKHGKANVKAKVTYTPDGGEPSTKSRTIRLVKKR
jgi:virginiamycin B lyase